MTKDKILFVYLNRRHGGKCYIRPIISDIEEVTIEETFIRVIIDVVTLIGTVQYDL